MAKIIKTGKLDTWCRLVKPRSFYVIEKSLELWLLSRLCSPVGLCLLLLGFVCFVAAFSVYMLIPWHVYAAVEEHTA